MILGMRVRTGPESSVDMTVTPITLHQRRGIMGLDRLGIYGDLRFGLTWKDGTAGLFDSALGPSVQLYGSADGRTDISLGATARTRAHSTQGWSLATPGFVTLTLPLARRSAARALGTFVPYDSTFHEDEWSVDFHDLEWGSWITPTGQTLTLYLKGAIGAFRNDQSETGGGVGIRWQ